MKKFIKLLFSLALLLVIFSFIDFNELLNELAHANYYLIALVVFGYFIGQTLSCLKWNLILNSGGLKTSYSKVFKAYFTGMFVNCFALGVLGGDLARALLVAGTSSRKSLALGSVVADRAHGLMMLSMIGLVSALIFGKQTISRDLMNFLIVFEFAVILGWFIGPYLLNKLPLKGKIKDILEQLALAFPRNKNTFLQISLVSLLFHCLQICLHILMLKALGANISVPVLFVIVPLINIFSTLPISWNGLGVREAAYLFFLTPMFISKAEAVALGGIWLLAVTVSSAIGAWIAVSSGNYAELFKRQNNQNS